MVLSQAVKRCNILGDPLVAIIVGGKIKQSGKSRLQAQNL